MNGRAQTRDESFLPPGCARVFRAFVWTLVVLGTVSAVVFLFRTVVWAARGFPT